MTKNRDSGESNKVRICGFHNWSSRSGSSTQRWSSLKPGRSGMRGKSYDLWDLLCRTCSILGQMKFSVLPAWVVTAVYYFTTVELHSFWWLSVKRFDKKINPVLFEQKLTLLQDGGGTASSFLFWLLVNFFFLIEAPLQQMKQEPPSCVWD